MRAFPSLLVVLAVAVLASVGCQRAQGGGAVPFALVFPGANSRPTYFTVHQVAAAQALATGAGVKVGILDHLFGTDLHPELYAGSANFLGSRGEWKLRSKDEHGYWMALTLREIAPGVEVYALNTASRDEEERATAVAAAIDWAIDHGISVLTYSQPGFSAAGRAIVDPAVERAHAAGIVTTFIHFGHPGNLLPGGLFPGLEDGREPDIHVLHYDYSVVFAPEYAKLQRGEKSDYRPFLSISSTSPVLAGVVAMMRERAPDLSPAACRDVLQATARPLELEGRQVSRALDAGAAVALAGAA
jgi:hypothetical protein